MSRISLILACIGLAGCSVLTRTKTGDWPEGSAYSRCYDERVARCRAEQRGFVAVNKCYPSADSDFQQGFVQAYVDIALGGNGDVPPIPPERYWKTCERDPEGYCEADHWFAGYSAGAQRAMASCWQAHNDVRGSGLYCN